MEAKPLPALIERNHEEVRSLEALEGRRGAVGPEDGVTEIPAHLIQHGDRGQEAELLAGHAGEQLIAQVVGDEPVISAKGGDRPAGLPDRESSEIEPARPALGLLDEGDQIIVTQLDPGAREQIAGLGPVHAELLRTQLQKLAVGAKGTDPARGLDLAGEHELRSAGEVVDEQVDRVQALRVADLVCVIEDQDEWRLHARQGRPEAREDQSVDRGCGRRERLERVLGKLLDPVKSGRDVAEQHDRVVVPVVEVDPTDWPGGPLHPLRQGGRLAITGGRRDEHDTALGGVLKSLDQRRTQDAPIQQLRRCQLGLKQF